jgi:Protein of unknown function (DUF2934)
MRSVSIRSTKQDRKTAAPPQQRTESPAQQPHALHSQIEKRAYELYGERGYRCGSALDDWLDAEREILGQTSPGSRAHGN